MPTATPTSAQMNESVVGDDEMFDLDLRITRSGPVAPETAAATYGDNCVMTDNCTHSRHCQH
jgi:hypothetical protein